MSDSAQEKRKKKSKDDSDLQCITAVKENTLRSKENISRIH